MSDSPGGPHGIADLRPLARAREQRAWYWYDWANSAYVTTVATVMFAPYIINIAEEAAVNDRISVLGLSVAPGALPSYLVTFSTILSALVLPLLGAVADRTENKKGLLGLFAWTGAGVRVAAVLLQGRQLGDRRRSPSSAPTSAWAPRW